MCQEKSNDCMNGTHNSAQNSHSFPWEMKFENKEAEQIEKMKEKIVYQEWTIYNTNWIGNFLTLPFSHFIFKDYVEKIGSIALEKAVTR